MRGNQLIFSRSGDRRKLYPVSPLLFPQSFLNNKYFLPNDNELPEGAGYERPTGGLLTTFLAFDFGFNDPSLIAASYDTVYVPLLVSQNFLAEAITGVAQAQAPASVSSVVAIPSGGSMQNVPPFFLFNIQHTHAGKTRQWFTKPVPNNLGLGTGEEPLMFKIPALVPAGDTLTAMIQNLAGNPLQAQICLIGAEFA